MPNLGLGIGTEKVGIPEDIPGEISFFSYKGVSASNTTSGTDTTLTKGIIVVLSSGTGANYALTDSESNVWILLDRVINTVHSSIYYCNNPNVSASHTFSNTGGFASFFVFKSTKTVKADQFNSNSGSNTVFTTGSISPTGGSKIIISNMTTNGSGTITPPSAPYTTLDNYNFTPAVNFGAACSYHLLDSTANQEASWSRSVSGTSVVSICSFSI